MKKKHTVGLLLYVICIYCLFIMPPVSYGWGPITHCTIGESTGTGAGFNNVPDYWDSWELSGAVRVAPQFLWSHEYKVTTAGVLGRKYEPTLNINMILDAEDDCPGHYFDVLMREKMEPARVTVTVQSVIRGWRAHNAADRVVHYRFFPAPRPGDNIALVWWHHKVWEEAVDKFIYVTILFHDLPEFAFNAKGQAVGYDFAGGVGCGDESSDRFLSLAQKVFRKKQATLDTTDMWALEPQTAGEIAGLRRGMERTLQQANLFDFTRKDYNKALQDYPLIAVTWQPFFTNAVNAVRALPYCYVWTDGQLSMTLENWGQP